MAAKLRVTLVKSPISHTQRTHGGLRALGLHRLGETVEVPDNAQMRGLTRAVGFLVKTEEVPAENEHQREPAPRRSSKEESTAS